MFEEYKETLNSIPEKELSILNYYAYESLYPKVSKKDMKYTATKVRDSTNNPKINRNSKCSCGSGKKYKNCCLELN